MGNGKRYLHCLKPTGAHPCSVGNFLKTDKGIISRTNKKPVISRRSRYLNAKMSKRCEKMMHRSYSDKWKEAHSPPPKKKRKQKGRKKEKNGGKGTMKNSSGISLYAPAVPKIIQCLVLVGLWGERNTYALWAGHSDWCL